MKIEVNVSKKYFFSILSILLITLGVFVASGFWDNSKTFFHDANDVKVAKSGVYYSLQELLDSGSLGGGITSNTALYTINSKCSNPGTFSLYSTCIVNNVFCSSSMNATMYAAGCKLAYGRTFCAGSEDYVCNNTAIQFANSCPAGLVLKGNGKDQPFVCAADTDTVWSCHWDWSSCSSGSCMFKANTGSVPTDTSNSGGGGGEIKECGFTGGYAYCCG